MLYYAAPMEGITTYVYRQAHARWYGGIDKYFTPFIAGKKMTSREVRDILPENNKGISLVPQILTNKAEDFLSIASRIASYGYDTVNLNLGCPSGTVTAKKKGAGFLSDPDALDAFLCEIYAKCPLKISVKTRLGVSGLPEWNRLLKIYTKYPLQELIVHTRLLQEFYTGEPHPEAYADAIAYLSASGIPLCYNGDITAWNDWQKVLEAAASAEDICKAGHYGLDRVMVGRGLLRNPALPKQLCQPQNLETGDRTGHDHRSDIDTLRAFHNEILSGYRQIMSGDLPVLFKMKELWSYMIMNPALCGADSSDSSDSSLTASEYRHPSSAGRYLKKIRKADRLSEYIITVDNLFRDYTRSSCCCFL